jgi:hypothetical protein
MPIREKTLRVYPNPWTYIDHLGRPAGVVRLDPFEHNSNRAWVGARIADVTVTRKAVTEIIRGKAFQGNASDHDITWEFDDGPIEIPNTAYYRGEINAGSLIAADKLTAQQSGISSADFLDPKQLLDAMKAQAIKDYDAQNGEGAHASFAASRSDEPAPKTSPALAAKPASKDLTTQPKGD